ncbi:MAG: YbaK/EbsC family protein [Pseudomonadota bacterium]
MSKSVRRVERAAAELGLDITVKRMDESTRTAEDAAAACGCDISQIVKSLVFQSRDSGDLLLLLVSGANKVDMDLAAQVIGEPLGRADANEVRARTGFAIGGVSPIGHLEPPEIWIDETLIALPTVWAAAGAPDAVFEITPEALVKATGAKVAKLSA